MGRAEILARKWIFKSSSPVPSTYQGCLQQYWGHFGVKVPGSGEKVWFWTPFWETTTNQGFGRDAWIVKLIFAMISV